MSDRLIYLRLKGAPVRNGQVPVDAFTGAVRKFASTMAFFERVYTDRSKRSSDLNVSVLSRENPLVVGLNPVSRLRGYSPDAAYRWAFHQVSGLGRANTIDPRVPLELLDNLFDISLKENEENGIISFTAEYDSEVIDFNGALANAARAKRSQLIAAIPQPQWFAGVSKGSIFGELRGVTDIDGEREFFLVPPRGPGRIKCVFTEEMRVDMIRLLFKTVRISGFLRYDGGSAHATLVEATSIVELGAEPAQSMRALEGIFDGRYYPVDHQWPQ